MSGRGGGVPMPKRKRAEDDEEADRREKLKLGGGGWDGHKDYMEDKNKKLKTQFGSRVPLLSHMLEGVVTRDPEFPSRRVARRVVVGGPQLV